MLTLLNTSDAPIPRSEVKRSIVLDNVTFSYSDAPVLTHARTQFIQGKKYAIVGKSGSGKSTLLKLLAGYYDNFDGTIRNNITLHSDYADAQVQAAVHATGLDKVVADLPERLDTSVAGNGARFSGGER